ncbi:MAG: conjugative transfer system coupling protein TraD [Gammaproteobacteria bacterium]
MNDPTTYDTPWRPNFEARIVAAWLATIPLALAVQRLTGLPEGPFLYVALGAACMVAAWLPRAWSHWRTHRRLRGRPLWFLDIGRLERQVRTRADAVWLGRGFEWNAGHAQRAFDLVRIGDSGLVRAEPGRLGAGWIHGLSAAERSIEVPIAHTEGHLLVVGTTGAGKTRLFDTLLAQAALRGEAVIIIDPKGDRELRDTARRICDRMGQRDRFVYFHPAFPESSVRLDPLHNFNRSSEIASRVAALIPSEAGSDPFKAFGQMALDVIVQGLLLIRQRPTLNRLRHYIESGPDPLVIAALEQHFAAHVPDWEGAVRPYLRGRARVEPGARAQAYIAFYKAEVQSRQPSTVLDGLVSRFEHEREHFQKMVASLMPVLSMLTSGELGPLLSPDPWDLDDDRPITDIARIINNAQVAYIGLDALADSIVGSAIGSMFLADLTSVAGDRYNFGVDNRPVNVFIDEAAEVLNDPFIQLLNKGRGAGVRCVIATQTFADFAARTGSEAKARQVLGNVNNTIALRVLDAETQAYFSESLPGIRVRHVQHGHGATTHGTHPVVFSGGHSERLEEEDAELFPPALLGRLPNLEYVASLSGGRVVKGRLPILAWPADRVDDRVARERSAPPLSPGSGTR